MRLHFLKTIWSDMIVLEHEGEFALVDTGFSEQFEQLSAYLDERKVTSISFILLTHFHRDHYGNIPALIEKYRVKRVYLKEYSGLDSTTAWGTAADDAYRQAEMDKYLAMQELVRKKSELVQVEDINEIRFGPYTLQLFGTKNTIREIYEDFAVPETYHKITCTENQNSIAVWMKAEGKNIFLGGDIMDAPSAHPLANFVNQRFAKAIGEQMDLYKVPHHGTVHTGTKEALAIYKPRHCILTNEDAYLKEHSDVYQNLREANPDTDIRLTEKETIVVDVEDL